MIDKKLIKERFKKSLVTYNQNSFVQNKMADNLIKMASPVKRFSAILELGCGSGLLTNKIKETFGYDIYDAVDIVSECEEYIKAISQDINFIAEDIEKFSTDKKYNLIISNATFQWIEKFPNFLGKIYENLEENGMFIFSTFGNNNFQEIKKITNESLNYYSCDELKNILQEYKPFTLKEEILSIDFETPIDILSHLKLTGVNSISSKHWTKKDLCEFSDKYKKFYPNIKLTYHPIYVAIIKI